MNLHALVKGAIGTVNPHILGSVLQSTGATIKPDGTPQPQYRQFDNIEMQVQSLTTKDLRQAEMLNLQGTLRSIYLFGEVDGIVRATAKGGDLIVIDHGVNKGVWLVNSVLEQWPDWCKVSVVLQPEAIPAVTRFIPSYRFNDNRNSGYLPSCS